MKKSDVAVLTVAVILSGCFLLSAAIAPDAFSLEGFALAIIAAFLAGIYSELKQSNVTAQAHDNESLHQATETRE